MECLVHYHRAGLLFLQGELSASLLSGLFCSIEYRWRKDLCPYLRYSMLCKTVGFLQIVLAPRYSIYQIHFIYQWPKLKPLGDRWVLHFLPTASSSSSSWSRSWAYSRYYCNCQPFDWVQFVKQWAEVPASSPPIFSIHLFWANFMIFIYQCILYQYTSLPSSLSGFIPIIFLPDSCKYIWWVGSISLDIQPLCRKQVSFVSLKKLPLFANQGSFWLSYGNTNLLLDNILPALINNQYALCYLLVSIKIDKKTLQILEPWADLIHLVKAFLLVNDGYSKSKRHLKVLE